MSDNDLEMMIPIAKSPLDAYRGTGRKAKEPKPDAPPKEKKKAGRKKKVVDNKLRIIYEPVVLSFD